MKVGAPVPSEWLACEVVDTGGDTCKLQILCGDGPALALYIRHFGCIACSEQVTGLIPRLHEFERLGIRVVERGQRRVAAASWPSWALRSSGSCPFPSPMGSSTS